MKKTKGSIDTSANKFIKGTGEYKPALKGVTPPSKKDTEDKIYYCTSCGKDYTRLKGNFRASQSPFYKGWGYIPVCLRCLDHFEQEYTKLLGSNDAAIKRLALHLDLYYNDGILRSSRKVNAGQSRISEYISHINLQQYKDKTYDNYLAESINDVILCEDTEVNAECGGDQKEACWTEGDIKNKNYIIQTIGYDCFDDMSYSEQNRKFLYNTLADYLSDEVPEDRHRLQSTIAMVKTLLQRENIDKLLNAQIRQPNINYSLIEQLGKIKAALTSDINSTAKENAISAKNIGRNTKNSNTLTSIMKEMTDDNFEEIKVNIVDVKMSAAYKEIAEQNAKALIAELNYQSDEYARLLGESRVYNENLQDRITELEEENRRLRVENKTNKSGGG